MKKVVIVDYGLGNIFSIKQALRKNGTQATVSNSITDIKNADGILLPGVGAFGDAMNRLKELNLAEPLREEANSGKPFLGVCLGMQLLFTTSNEFGSHNGLNLLSGTVQKFPHQHNNINLSVPFIGWNRVEKKKDDSFTLNFESNTKLFLVHSFYAEPSDRTCILGTSHYHDFEYPVLIRKGNIFGVQGHPEKSGPDGLKIYENWLKSL